MDNIKSFIYLDEYKMYSISSQLFEGLTEYILSGEKESTNLTIIICILSWEDLTALLSFYTSFRG